MDARHRKMHVATATQARPPTRSPVPSDWSYDENNKDGQARAPMAEPLPQDPQPSTSFGTYHSTTLPKVLSFGRGKIAPLACGTLTIGHGCSIPIDQTATTKEAAIAFIPPSPHRVVHGDCVQTYDEPPVPSRCRHWLANWTSVRLGNDPCRQTIDKKTMGQQDYNLFIDPMDQQNGEINDDQSTDSASLYSDYSTNHMEDVQ